MHPQLRKSYVPLSCPSLVVFWPLYINWYSGVVMHTCSLLPLLLWSVKPFYSGWLGETNSSTSSISRIGSKQLYSADQNANPAFVLLYLGALPSLCQECHENCTTSYEFLTQWYFSPSLFIPRSRVVTTGIPTSEPWCVKSILWATRCLVVNGNTLILSVLVIESSS